MDPRSKRRLLRSLLNTHTKAVDLEGALRFKREEEEASGVGRRANALRREIDRLRRGIWSDWSGRATVLETEIKRGNKSLQAAIRDIEKDVKTAERIAKALGQIDRVIDIAAALLG